MPPPDDLDCLSHAELKGLVVKQWEQMVELQRLVAALRDEIARLKGGPGRPNLKPSGMERGTEPKPPGNLRRAETPAGQHALEACDRRGTDRHGGRPTARLTLQRLHELRGAGFDDPSACGEFPLRTLAGAGWRHGDGAVADRHRWSLRAGTAPLRARPISSRADDGAASGDAVARVRHCHLQASGHAPADQWPGRLLR